jgi:hypothetical protein
MGRATVMVDPAIVGMFLANLPCTTRVVGSAECAGAISLILQADGLEDGSTVTAHIVDDGVSRIFTLQPVPKIRS